MDEQWLIVTNTKALEGFKSLGSSFQTSILHVYYRPLLLCSFVLDYNLHALAPKAYHLTNILLHCICVFLLFQVLVKFKVEKSSALLLALLFALHPMAVHAVAWVPGRNDSLLALFFLSATLLLFRYFETKKITFLLFHFLAVLAALFTKESALVLPIIFLILLYKKEKKDIFLFAAVWILACILWFFAKQSLSLKPLYPNGNMFSALLDGSLAFVFNAGKLIAPVYQSVSPLVKGPQLWISIIVLVPILYFLFKSTYKNKNFAFFGLAVVVLGFAPVLWFSAHTPLQEQYEHRAYLPLVGLLILISQSQLISSKKFITLLLLLSTLYATKTLWRIPTYATEFSFLKEGSIDCEENYMLQTKMGNYYMLQKMYPEALSYFNTAVKRQPEKPQLLNSRANVYVELGMKKEAIADYTKALQFSNHNYSVYMARCWAYWKFKDLNNAYRDMEGIKNRYPGQMDAMLEAEIIKAWRAELAAKQQTQ